MYTFRIKYALLAAWQTVLSMIQFGKMSWMFSDIAMSGYTSAAGVTLLTSQLKTMFGLKLERFNGQKTTKPKAHLNWVVAAPICERRNKESDPEASRLL